MEEVKMALTDTHVLGAEAPAVETTAVEVVADESVKENYDPATLGSLSSKWEFIASVEDQTQKDKNQVKDKKTGKVREVITGKFIGYIFKALESGLQYPQMAITYDFIKKPFKVDNVEWKTAKKGEEVFLTTAEAVGLLSQPEINGVINGGKYAVQANYKKSAAAAGADSDAVLPITGFVAPAGDTPSLKALEVRTAITGTPIPGAGRKDEKTGKMLFATLDKKVEKGFERLAPALEAKPRKSAGTAAGTAAIKTFTHQRNDNAAAFAAAFNACRV